MNEATIERVAKHLAASNGDPSAWGAYAHQAMQVIELAEDQWEPMETAPKAEIEILVNIPDKMHIVYYGNYSSKPHGNFPWVSSDGGNAWREDIPTHWRPLPKPPKV
jgi:hypothetical protein